MMELHVAQNLFVRMKRVHKLLSLMQIQLMKFVLKITFIIHLPEMIILFYRSQLWKWCLVIQRKSTALNKLFFSDQLKVFNFMANAELITTVDSVVRQAFVMIEKLSMCVGYLNAHPPQLLAKFWVVNLSNPIEESLYTDDPNDPVPSVSFEVSGADFTHPLAATRLLTLLTGDNNGSGSQRYLYGRKISEFLTYVRGYYSPCLAKLQEDDLEFSGGLILTKHWVEIDECAKPACLVGVVSFNSSDCVLHSFSNGEAYDPVHNLDVDYLVDSYCIPTFKEGIMSPSYFRDYAR
mmetsp:Transcript_38714/g.89997  ORF Transcript_38714/g.89997 Transcript_38714/m.89997 type:complete len:293 (+) Transcript_38714:1219-2097(+)